MAYGDSFFGPLTAKPSLALGEPSYGIYLLHGLVLYVTLASTPLGYWLVYTHPGYYPLAVIGLSPLLILLSYVTYQWIERPGIQAGRRVARRCADFLRPAVALGEETLASVSPLQRPL